MIFFFILLLCLFNHQLQYACRVAVQRASQQLIVWKDLPLPTILSHSVVNHYFMSETLA